MTSQPEPPPSGDAAAPSEPETALSSALDDDDKEEMDSKIDAFIGDVADFLADLARTWGVMFFRPWSAAKDLLEHGGNQGDRRYASHTAFLVMVSLVNGFFVGIFVDVIAEPASINFSVTDVTGVLEDVLSSISLDFKPWKIALAILSIAILYAFGRVMSRCIPQDKRKDGLKIAFWAIAFSSTGQIVFAAIFFLMPFVFGMNADSPNDPPSPVEVVRFIAFMALLCGLPAWVVFVAPLLVFRGWLREANASLGAARWLALGSVFVAFVVTAAWIGSKVHLTAKKAELISGWEAEAGVEWGEWERWAGWDWSEQEAELLFEDPPLPMWFTPVEVTESRITGTLYNFSGRPHRHCKVYWLVVLDNHGTRWHSSLISDSGSRWLTPNETEDVSFAVFRSQGHDQITSEKHLFRPPSTPGAICCAESFKRSCLLGSPIRPPEVSPRDNTNEGGL